MTKRIATAGFNPSIISKLFGFKPFLLFFSIFFISCAQTNKVSDHPTTQATLWVQNAAEYHALTSMVYQTAASNLPLAKEDSYWSAIPYQDDSYQDLPPAIILDVDETVLDNSAFQARMIKQGSDFDIEQWNDWVMEANAEPVPGSLEFTRRAADKGIKIIYLTNREASVEEGTRKNLQILGYPLPADEDVILSKNERSEWTSDKINRRKFVADNYRVLMLFGDDLNDFIPAKDMTVEERMSLVNDNRQRWGQKWYILPNPVYGSWEQALYNFSNSLTESEKEDIILKNLDSKNVQK